MDLATAIRTCLQKYVTFSGRARRSEFWWWVLAYLAASTVAVIFDAAAFGHRNALFSGLLSLVAFLPSLAVAARRLHDIDKSGWWQLLWLIPLIGPLILIFWWTRPGETGPNRFGLDPINPAAGADASFVDPSGV